MRVTLKRIVVGLVLLAVAGAVAVTMLFPHSYVKTTSMYPTIPPGSMIFVAKESGYHVGEVIEFRANGMTWAHRLVGMKPDGTLITKGDNPRSTRDIFTHPLTQAAVIGKVVAAPRWIGFPELIVNSPAYGLAWLRFELGLAGKLAMVTAVGVLSSLLVFTKREKTRVEPTISIDLRDPAGDRDDSPAAVAPVTV